MTAIEILENSKKTHEDWLAYFVKYPDQEKTEEHKHLGDRFFHEQCITNYERVIKKIEQLITELKKARERNRKLQEEVKFLQMLLPKPKHNGGDA